MLAEPLLVVGRIAAAFERLRIRYVLGGSLASSLHGIPRATMDVDLVAEMAAWHAAPLARALESEFFVDPEMIVDAISRHASFNVIYLPTMFKADVFVLKPDPWWEVEMERGREELIGAGTDALRLRVATAEDTLLYKFVWYRLGNQISDRQWQDALGILRVQRNTLDWRYLRTWARHLDVTELLEKAVAEAGVG